MSVLDLPNCNPCRNIAERSGFAANRLNASVVAAGAAGIDGITTVAERASARAGDWAEVARKVGGDAAKLSVGTAPQAPPAFRQVRPAPISCLAQRLEELLAGLILIGSTGDAGWVCKRVV
jgi:hypothetical protein